MKFSLRNTYIFILAVSTANALSVSEAKAKVLNIAKDCKEQGGVFVSDNSKRKDLQKAVAELEAICGPPDLSKKDAMVGEWTLLSTTNINPLPPLPLSFLPRNPIQDELRKVVYSNVDVMQKIRNDISTNDSNDDINRVDNVIQFTTPTEGSLAALPNPLSLSRAKITLCHNAKIESVTPLLRTKISLKSVILTIAGKSQYLDPDGADVLGINLPPVQDILNAGVFDTTYVDDEIRISRGPAVSGYLDEQLRVFLRCNARDNDEDDDGTESDPFLANDEVEESNMSITAPYDKDIEKEEIETESEPVITNDEAEGNMSIVELGTSKSDVSSSTKINGIEDISIPSESDSEENDADMSSS